MLAAEGRSRCAPHPKGRGPAAVRTMPRFLGCSDDGRGAGQAASQPIRCLFSFRAFPHRFSPFRVFVFSLFNSIWNRNIRDQKHPQHSPYACKMLVFFLQRSIFDRNLAKNCAQQIVNKLPSPTPIVGFYFFLCDCRTSHQRSKGDRCVKDGFCSRVGGGSRENPRIAHPDPRNPRIGKSEVKKAPPPTFAWVLSNEGFLIEPS